MVASKKKLFVVEHISKVFGDRYIFNDISFNIKQGEIFGIIGSSGSGKTTMLNILVGFLKPEKGDVKITNSNKIREKTNNSSFSVYKYQKRLKKMYGFASQSPSFYPNLKVIENLRYFGSLYDLPKETIKTTAENLLTLVGLAQFKHTLARKLSGGMQRRLDIACSLIHSPKILIVDEPTADLDPVLSNKIWNLIRVINQQGTTIIIASHDLAELEQLCSRIAIIKDSKIAALGKPSELKSVGGQERLLLKSSPGKYKIISGAIKKLDKSITKVISKYEVGKKSLQIYTKKPAIVMPHLLKTLEKLDEKLINIDFVKPNLDSVFKKINESPKEEKKKRKKHKKHHKHHKHRKHKK